MFRRPQTKRVIVATPCAPCAAIRINQSMRIMVRKLVRFSMQLVSVGSRFFLRGSDTEAIYDYASTKDLLLPDSWMSDPDWRWEDRPLRHMCGLEASDAEKKVFAEVEQAFDAFLDKASLMDEPGEKSLGNLLDEKFHEWAKRKEHDARMMQAAFEFKKREFISGIGSLDLYTASLAGYVQAEDVGPECVPLRRGYSSIVQALLQEIPDSEIVYGSGVKEVKNRDDHVEVFLESGSAIVARAAVVTVSLGVLKSGDLRFTPKLPEEKLEAIRKTGFGHIEKCILKFDADTWEDLKQGFHCLWPPEGDAFRPALLRNWEAWQSDPPSLKRPPPSYHGR